MLAFDQAGSRYPSRRLSEVPKPINPGIADGVQGIWWRTPVGVITRCSSANPGQAEIVARRPGSIAARSAAPGREQGGCSVAMHFVAPPGVRHAMLGRSCLSRRSSCSIQSDAGGQSVPWPRCSGWRSWSRSAGPCRRRPILSGGTSTVRSAMAGLGAAELGLPCVEAAAASGCDGCTRCSSSSSTSNTIYRLVRARATSRRSGSRPRLEDAEGRRVCRRPSCQVTRWW
jgi:hypothetical protein